MSTEAQRAPVAGRREQRKARLRQTVKDAAWRLVSEHGYATVTVEQIAAASDISVATFYRHFTGKDDAVTRGWLTTDLLDDVIETAGTREPLARTVRVLFARYAAIVQTYEVDLLTRLEMIEREPSLRACLVMGREHDIATLAGLFARRYGHDQPTHELRTAAGLVIVARSETLSFWARTARTGSLAELLDRAARIIAPSLDACEAAAKSGGRT